MFMRSLPDVMKIIEDSIFTGIIIALDTEMTKITSPYRLTVVSMGFLRFILVWTLTVSAWALLSFLKEN